MKSRAILTCLALFLGSVGFAQTTPPSELQPAAGPQLQSETKTAADAQKDSDKKDDSDHSRKIHFRLGTVSLAGGYLSGPFFYGPSWPYGFYPYSFAYSPFLFSPFYSPFYPGYLPNLAYGADKGEVRLKAPKNAEVFVDGAYAGTADHLKNMWLDSGAYDLSVSATGRSPFHQRIYVLSGKSLKIDARLGPQKEKSQTEEKP
ncbi:MAG TPA: PEGA domain-containing protein [Candidatus Angelobacter sp.]|nr:PEGA domain-containing protein [Candidatus Angelobacter sp.]